jgi:hypothetical protein
MKKLIISAIAFAFLGGLFAAPAFACCYTNKDVHQGVQDVPVWDFKVILQGEVNVLWWYTGYPDAWRFQQFEWWHPGDGTTVLKWWDPIGPSGEPGPIPYCVYVHVGWLIDPPTNVILCSWTDEHQNPIFPQGFVKEPSHFVTPLPDPVLILSYWIEYGEAEVSDFYYQFYQEEIPLDQLNDRNPMLDPANMIPVPGSWVIPPGSEVFIPIPDPPGPDWYYVYRFKGWCDNIFEDFGQHQMEEEQADIPTLTEWGMIILALLLLTAGTIAVVRRRKAAMARTN